MTSRGAPLDVKAACREGLSSARRRAIWLQLTQATSRADYYLAALKEVFGTAIPIPSVIYQVRRRNTVLVPSPLCYRCSRALCGKRIPSFLDFLKRCLLPL